jgi:hypothetical protein
VLRTYPSIRVWVAGCSTGEEVYALAILLREEGVLDRTILYASDINPHALQAARDGIYPLDRLPQFSASYLAAGGRASLADYYTAGYGAAVFDKTLTRNVVFADHSLATDEVFAEMHLVSCRNVLIYFNRTLQDRAVGLFARSLSPRGSSGSARRRRFVSPRTRPSSRRSLRRRRSIVARGRLHDPSARERAIARPRHRRPDRHRWLCRRDRDARPALCRSARRLRGAARRSRASAPAPPERARRRPTDELPAADRRSAGQGALVPGRVHVAPPDYHMLVDEGATLALSVEEPVHYSVPAIDVLFESAAVAFGPRVAAVVLSGANRDGADGLAAVARAGGLALVHDPRECVASEMPTAALASTPDAVALSLADLRRVLAGLGARAAARM